MTPLKKLKVVWSHNVVRDVGIANDYYIGGPDYLTKAQDRFTPINMDETGGRSCRRMNIYTNNCYCPSSNPCSNNNSNSSVNSTSICNRGHMRSEGY